jgi:hypothetical protein
VSRRALTAYPPKNPTETTAAARLVAQEPASTSRLIQPNSAMFGSAPKSSDGTFYATFWIHM